MKPRHTKAIAGLAGFVTAAGLLLAGGAAAHAAAPTPPWEPDPNGVGTLSFYDSSGALVTSGGLDDSPIAAYAVGSGVPRAGDVSALLYGCLPTQGETTALWSCDQLSAATAYPLTTGPANIQTMSQTDPVHKGGPGELTLNDLAGDFPNDGSVTTNPDYEFHYQIRLRTSNSGGNQSNSWDEADVLINPSANTWTQVYPAVVPATTTVLTSSKNPPFSGDSVTLTATESPAAAGTVQFKDGSSTLGSPVAVNGSGVATFSTSALTVGSHSLSAVFTPTDPTSFGPSTGTLTQVVNPAATATTTALAITGDTTAGTDATLTATVSPAAAPGSVSFVDNGSTVLGTVSTETGGNYVLDLPSGFAAGSHSVVATFNPTDPTAFESSHSAAQAFFTNPAAQTGSACAQTGSSCTDTQNIQGTIPIGTLTITTPYDAAHPLDMGTLALTTDASEFSQSVTFHNIVVTDDRSGGSGWTATALATDLSDGGTNPNSVIDSQNVGLTNITAVPGTGFIGPVVGVDNPAATPVAAPGAPGSAGLGGTTAHTFATATNSEGSVTMSGLLTLNAPTSTEAGLFKGTIVFTVG
jgi:hypothetical protein